MPPKAANTNARERHNALIHHLFTTNNFDECLQLINWQLKQSAFCEFPIYVKGLIFRRRGMIEESLTLFQSVACLNPRNTSNLKQVGHSLYLLGKPKQAIDVYDEARKIHLEDAKSPGTRGALAEDWEVLHHTGMCYLGLDQASTAVDCFRRANEAAPHEATSKQLGQALVSQGLYQDALDVYADAIARSPESADLLTTAGLLSLRVEKSREALSFLSRALTLDPRNER